MGKDKFRKSLSPFFVAENVLNIDAKCLVKI